MLKISSRHNNIERTSGYYPDLERLIKNDSFFSRELARKKWKIPDLIELVDHYLSDYMPIKHIFVPQIQGSQSIVICFDNMNGKYVVRIPANNDRESPYSEERIAFLQKYDPLFEKIDSSTGVYVQKWGGWPLTIDSYKFLPLILNALHRFHEINEIIGIEMNFVKSSLDMLDDYCLSANGNIKDRLLELKELYETIDSKLYEYEIAPIYGDAAINNVLYNNRDISICDLEDISDGDPMYDVCKMLFSIYYSSAKKGIKYDIAINRGYRQLEPALSSYYGRQPSYVELKHAYLVYSLVEWQYFTYFEGGMRERNMICVIKHIGRSVRKYVLRA